MHGSERFSSDLDSLDSGKENRSTHDSEQSSGRRKDQQSGTTTSSWSFLEAEDEIFVDIEDFVEVKATVLREQVPLPNRHLINITVRERSSDDDFMPVPRLLPVKRARGIQSEFYGQVCGDHSQKTNEPAPVDCKRLRGTQSEFRPRSSYASSEGTSVEDSNRPSVTTTATDLPTADAVATVPAETDAAREDPLASDPAVLRVGQKVSPNKRRVESERFGKLMGRLGIITEEQKEANGGSSATFDN
jgi:hypothetical protein